MYFLRPTTSIEALKKCQNAPDHIIFVTLTLMRLSSRSIAETGDATVATSGVADCVAGANR